MAQISSVRFGGRWSKSITPSVGRQIGLLVDAGELTASEALVVLGELVLGGANGHHIEPVAVVAGGLGVSERMVRTARAKAAALGLVDVQARYWRRGRHLGRQLTSKVAAGRRLAGGGGWSPLLTWASLVRAVEAARAERSASLWAVLRAWATGELEAHRARYSDGAAYAISRAIEAAGIYSTEGRKASFFCPDPPREIEGAHSTPEKEEISVEKASGFTAVAATRAEAQGRSEGDGGQDRAGCAGAHHGEGLSGRPPNDATASKRGDPEARLRREAGQVRMRRCASGKSRRCWGEPLGQWEFCTSCWQAMGAAERWPTYRRWRDQGSRWAEIEMRQPPPLYGELMRQIKAKGIKINHTPAEREAGRRGLAMAKAALNRGGDAPEWLGFKPDTDQLELDVDPDGYDVEL